jgi:hypothetical protein
MTAGILQVFKHNTCRHCGDVGGGGVRREGVAFCWLYRQLERRVSGGDGRALSCV